MDDLVAEFDDLLSEAPLDFMGTGSFLEAKIEQRYWDERVADFRDKLVILVRQRGIQ